MSILKTIKDFLSQTNETKTAPEGLCPNCWGRQEYEGKFYEALKNNHVDIHNLNENKGWIEKYFDENLSQIKLVKNEKDELTCSKCKLSFKEI